MTQERFKPGVTVGAIIERDGRFLLVEALHALALSSLPTPSPLPLGRVCLKAPSS